MSFWSFDAPPPESRRCPGILRDERGNILRDKDGKKQICGTELGKNDQRLCTKCRIQEAKAAAQKLPRREAIYNYFKFRCGCWDLPELKKMGRKQRKAAVEALLDSSDNEDSHDDNYDG